LFYQTCRIVAFALFLALKNIGLDLTKASFTNGLRLVEILLQNMRNFFRTEWKNI